MVFRGEPLNGSPRKADWEQPAMMRISSIPYRGGELEAREQGDVWTVRLTNLEVRASYLDLALAELLGSAPEAHRAAAKLLSQLADVVEQQEAAYSSVAAVPPRTRPGASRRGVLQRMVLLGFRVAVFAVVATTAFMLTTWLTAFR
jgi:uncharacterized coiled-coil protein SlyX